MGLTADPHVRACAHSRLAVWTSASVRESIIGGVHRPPQTDAALTSTCETRIGAGHVPTPLCHSPFACRRQTSAQLEGKHAWHRGCCTHSHCALPW